MKSDKIACLFFNISLGVNRYESDNFFEPNAVKSFKRWNPDVEVHVINNSNFHEYMKDLEIEEYYEDIGLIMLMVIKRMFEKYNYKKIFQLGIDTITCSRLDEFIDNCVDDIICTTGTFHSVVNEHYITPILEFIEGDMLYRDVASINGDVVCINNKRAASVLLDTTLKIYTSQTSQGGLNYCYINQKELKLSVSIVDFPYFKTKVVYNIRSKGVVGGYCLVRGNVLDGRRGRVISNTYPSTLFVVKDDKLFTHDDKQIKVFHFCEGLGYKTDDVDELTYDEQINEMKTMWFNERTLEFFKNKCECIF